MSRRPQLNETLTALESATRAYMAELQFSETLPPKLRLRFANLGKEILELEGGRNVFWSTFKSQARSNTVQSYCDFSSHPVPQSIQGPPPGRGPAKWWDLTRPKESRPARILKTCDAPRARSMRCAKKARTRRAIALRQHRSDVTCTTSKKEPFGSAEKLARFAI